MNRNKRIGGMTAVAAALVVANGILAVPASAAPNGRSADQHRSESCRSLPELTPLHVDANGQRVSAETPGAGLVRRFVLDGTVVRETVPPARWNPLTASDVQLARFGLPPRPRTESGIAGWSATVRREARTSRTTSGMCVSDVSAAAVPTAATQNWSGYLNLGEKGEFWDASAAFVQPHFTAGCAGPSAHALFAGLGGWFGSPGLIEAGTDTFEDRTDGAQGFWELGDNIHHTDTHEIRLPNFVLRGGELATVATVVAPDPLTGMTAAYFYLGVPGGPSVFIGPIDQMPGTNTPIGDIYDGTSAEYIDERPLNLTQPDPVDGLFYFLRESVDAHGRPAATHWLPATKAGEPGLSHTLVTMQRHNGNVLEDPHDRSIGFDNQWHACA